MGVKKLIFIIGSQLLVILILLSSCSQQVSLNSLLQEMTDRYHLTYFPSDQNSLKQFSSYNRASVR
ncbi:MAG: hypothetical protein KAI29_30540, partial [Cyclobacteriaceae bacterium]|nr:hypothetical protein [Cyclobacteriaceae bacterium]